MKIKPENTITKNQIESAIDFINGLIESDEREQLFTLHTEKIHSVTYTPENSLLNNDMHASEKNTTMHLWQPDNPDFPLDQFDGVIDLSSDML